MIKRHVKYCIVLTLLKTGAPVAISLKDAVATVTAPSPTAEEPDQVVVVELL